MKKTVACIILLISSMLLFIPAGHDAKAQTSQTTVTFDQASVNATSIDQTFTLNIVVSNVQNLWGWLANVTYDSKYVQFQSAAEGSFLTSQGYPTLFLKNKPVAYRDAYSNIETLQLVVLQDAISSSDSSGNEQSMSGNGVLATLTFEAVNQTSSTSISLSAELEGPNDASAKGLEKPNPIITADTTYTTDVSLIVPGPPTANAGPEQSVNAGTQVILNGSQTVATGGNATYTWTFMDGTLQTLTGMIANYTFDTAGNYTVTLTVTDPLGTSNSTVIIHVLGSLATATPAPTVAPTASSTGVSATATPTPTATTPQQTSTGSFSLPPTIVGILVFITIIVLVGSIFWLRKQT